MRECSAHFTRDPWVHRGNCLEPGRVASTGARRRSRTCARQSWKRQRGGDHARGQRLRMARRAWSARREPGPQPGRAGHVPTVSYPRHGSPSGLARPHPEGWNRDMLEQRAITVGTGPVTFGGLVAVARRGAKVALSPESLTEVRRARAVIEALAEDPEPHYGISTGFGALATRHIPTELRARLQRSLIRSHAAGSGGEVEREVVRAMMLLRISTLATGRTGVREGTLTAYVAMLNAGITPIVHEYGSLGCSGDLAPLAHCALALTGEGTVRDAAGIQRPAAEALAAAGLDPGRARREGGAGADQRHGRDARHAGAGDHRSAGAARRGRHRRRDERGRPARHRRRLRRGPAAAPSPPGTAGLGRQPSVDHGGERDPGVAPYGGLHPGPGRLLVAVLPPGRRGRSGHRRPRGPGRGDRARRGDRQSGGHPRLAGGVQRQLPRRAPGLRARLPGHRGRGPGQHLRAPYRPVPRTPPGTPAFPRSWPAIRVSTPGT